MAKKRTRIIRGKERIEGELMDAPSPIKSKPKRKRRVRRKRKAPASSLLRRFESGRYA